MKAAYGFFRRKITVYLSGVSTRVIRSQPSRVNTFVCGSRIVFTVNATSADVNGAPSCQTTPRRNLNVKDLPSAEIKPFAFVGTCRQSDGIASPLSLKTKKYPIVNEERSLTSVSVESNG